MNLYVMAKHFCVARGVFASENISIDWKFENKILILKYAIVIVVLNNKIQNSKQMWNALHTT